MACLTVEQIESLACDDRDRHEASTLQHHVEQCRTCRARLDESRANEEALRELRKLPDSALIDATGTASPVTPKDASSRPDSPPEIPDFHLIRSIGQGAFGRVWLARSKTGVHRAVKILHKPHLTEVEFDGIRAYEIHARGHANLVQILHVGETADCFYYVMELADGYGTAPTFRADDYEPRTLEGDLRKCGTLGLRDMVAVSRQILAGLQHLHERGLLHRDVKPSSVVFVDGVAKLADIGLLTQERDPTDRGRTLRYAPPEGVVDRSGDLHCLGKTLYEAATGLTADQFPATPSDVSPVPAGGTRRVMPVIERACAADPNERFQTAEEFRRALDRRVRSSWRRWLPAVAGIVAVLGVVLALSHVFRGPSNGRLSILCKESRDATVHFVVSREHIPLRTRECIQLELELDRPAYPIVALVGDAGIQIVYPTAQTQQVPVTDLTVPTDGGWWVLEPPEGTLTFVLLAGDRPIGDVERIRQELAALEGRPQVGADAMIIMKNGAEPELVRAPPNRTRGIPDVRRTVRARAGMLDRLREDFADEFGVICAVAVPQRAAPVPAKGG